MSGTSPKNGRAERVGGRLGILDWGVGGLGLYKLIRQQSDIPVVYFSDSGHQPYGRTPTNQLHDRLHGIFQYLFSQGATRVAIACNAASAAYADTDTIKGIITHGVNLMKKADPSWQKVGLLAGRSTVYSHIFPNRLGPRHFVLRQRVSQPLSAHVEAGRLDGPALHTDLKHIMAPLRHADAVLLACTHYPAIQHQIARYVADHCQMLDPAQEMADWIFNNWQFDTSDKPDRWFTSGPVAQLRTNGKAAFGVDIRDIEKSPI